MAQPLLDRILSILLSDTAAKNEFNESSSLLPLLQKLDSSTNVLTYDKDKMLMLAEGLE